MRKVCDKTSKLCAYDTITKLFFIFEKLFSNNPNSGPGHDTAIANPGYSTADSQSESENVDGMYAKPSRKGKAVTPTPPESSAKETPPIVCYCILL